MSHLVTTSFMPGCSRPSVIPIVTFTDQEFFSGGSKHFQAYSLPYVYCSMMEAVVIFFNLTLIV